MAYKLPWPHPYPDMVSMGYHQVSRLTIEVPRVDVETIKAVLVHPSAITLVVQLAIKQTAQYVRDNKLAYPEDAERFLKYIRERSFSEPLAQALAPDDAGGSPGVRGGVETAEDKPTSTREKAPRGKGAGRGRVRGIGNGNAAEGKDRVSGNGSGEGVSG